MGKKKQANEGNNRQCKDLVFENSDIKLIKIFKEYSIVSN